MNVGHEKFQMSWKTLKESANEIVWKCIDGYDKCQKERLVVHLTNLIFPDKGDTGMQIIWRTEQGITYATSWGQQHVLNNLRLAMLKEQLGLGLDQYVVELLTADTFERKSLLFI